MNLQKITTGTVAFLSVVDRHPFDADPDQELNYDADPHPDPDRHQNNTDPTQNLANARK